MEAECPIVSKGCGHPLFHMPLWQSYNIRCTGRVGLIIPIRSHFTDQITEVLEDHISYQVVHRGVLTPDAPACAPFFQLFLQLVGEET